MAAEVGRMKTAKNRSNELGVREYSVGKNAQFCLKSTLMLVEDDELDSGLKQKILHGNIENFFS